MWRSLGCRAVLPLVLSLSLSMSLLGPASAQQYGGPKTGVVDETGAQVFGPARPGYVQGTVVIDPADNLAKETGGNLAQAATDLGPPGATACATDTGSCSLNALIQRVAQRITSLIAALGSPVQAGATLPTNVTQWVGEALGAMANYGTSPGAVKVPGVNAALPDVEATIAAGTAPAKMVATGCVYNATAPAATDTQALAIQCDEKGRQRVNSQPATQNSVTGTANTTGNSTTSLVGAVANNRIYVSAFSCANTGTSASLISFQDGSGGSTLWTTIVPAGGGSNMDGAVPLFKTTSGNGVYFLPATASTTTYCSAAGFSGP